MTDATRLHGGPDASGVPLHDFSTNSNAGGPCPLALATVQAADSTRYPDPSYTVLQTELAAFHGVDTSRVLLAASASEFIFRISGFIARRGATLVQIPRHSFGDYADAARVWGLHVTQIGPANLRWHTDPSSPLGQSPQVLGGQDFHNVPTLVPQIQVLDRAYEPLRLSGQCTWTAERLSQVWQLWSPNKALGLTGVRAAYAIAPTGAEDVVTHLNRLGSSWPLGAHGVALLRAWVQADTQTWLAESLNTLRIWKAQQINRVKSLGWVVLPSETNFFCAKIADPYYPMKVDALLIHLRRHGIKLRDASSFGLPGHVRLAVQPVVAQDALIDAVRGMKHFDGAHPAVTAPLTQDFV